MLFLSSLAALVYGLASQLCLDVQSCPQRRLQHRHPLLALLDVFPQARLFSIRLRERRLDLCHLVRDLRVLPLRMSNLPVTSLICVGEISLAIAQVLELVLLRFALCLKLVAHVNGMLTVPPRVAEVLLERLYSFLQLRQVWRWQDWRRVAPRRHAGGVGIVPPQLRNHTLELSDLVA